MATTHQSGCARFELAMWRVFEGFAGLLGIVVSAGVLYVRHFHPSESQVSYGGVTSAVSQEFFIALLVFSCLSFVGALTASKRVERILGRASWRAIAFLLLWLLVGRLFGAV
jgi:hypothetical protein